MCEEGMFRNVLESKNVVNMDFVHVYKITGFFPFKAY